MPARKTTTAKTTAKSTSTSTQTTRKRLPNKRASTKKTTTPSKRTIDKLKSQFQEMGGLFQEDGDRATVSIEDRYTSIESANLNQWVQDNLSDIEGIYERGDQKQWLENVFPNSLIKTPEAIEETVPEQTPDETSELDEQAIAQQDALKIIELLNTPDDSILSEELRTKVENLKGKSLRREQVMETFDIKTNADDDMELCNQLSSLGVAISVINTGGDKNYIIV